MTQVYGSPLATISASFAFLFQTSVENYDDQSSREEGWVN